MCAAVGDGDCYSVVDWCAMFSHRRGVGGLLVAGRLVVRLGSFDWLGGPGACVWGVFLACFYMLFFLRVFCDTQL